MSTFKKGDLIIPDKSVPLIKTNIWGPASQLGLQAKVFLFESDITLTVLDVFRPDSIEVHDLLFCYDPDVGSKEWFQIPQRHATLVNKQKEDNKLKLTKDDIGKEFECNYGVTYEVILVGEGNAVLLMDNNTDRYPDEYLACSLCGSIDNVNALVKRHEPRWWLSQFPDADLFNDGWFSCGEKGKWHFTETEPVEFKGGFYRDNIIGSGKSEYIISLIMPTLKVGEWKLSKISTDELRELQRVGK